MMSLARVGVRHAQNYYRQDNYYSESSHIENSAWFGRGAEILGLTGMVESAAFNKLLEGQKPDGNVLLATRKTNHSGEKRAGLDMTFSAPKSVSLLALIAGDQRVEAAHRRAVEAALKIAQDRYSLTRRGGHEHRQTEVAGNLIVAQFQHDTSRAKDPQLHTHCVAINAVQRSDGEWRSLLNDGIFANAKLLGLIYKNALGHELENLGFTLQRNSDGTFEVEGYNKEALRAFSKRREQILAEGAETAREARQAVKKNRPAKGRELSREELVGGWRQEATFLGIRHPRSLGEQSGVEVDHRPILETAVSHASERDVRFRREALERFALESNMGQLDLTKFGREILTAGSRFDLLQYEQGKFTTAEAIKTEEQILGAIKRGRGRLSPIATELPDSTQKQGMTAGQKAALELSLTTKDQFIAWQGVAGAGKTFAMNELRKVAEKSGYTVRGFAPSAEAAKVLASEGKLEAQTVAALLTALVEKATSRELWIVDEAGLLSARDTAKLLDRAEETKARVMFVGDTRQLSSVEAGNPFKLMQQHTISTAHLTESRRQKTSELKAAARAMAHGDMTSGLKSLKDQIIEYKRESTRVKHVAADYLALDSGQRNHTLILAGTNRERELLTRAIREGLRNSGELGKSVTIKVLERKDLTRAEAKETLKIEVQDRLIFQKDYAKKSILRDIAWEVTAINHKSRELTLRDAKGRTISVCSKDSPAFQVYRKRELEIAPGDLMRWTKNDKNLGLRNGQELVVTGVSKTLSLMTKDGSKISLPSSGYLHLDHNYVNTVYGSQGKSAENVLISVDHTFGREPLYVAVTRAKSSLKIYTENKEQLLRIAEVSRAKISALDLVPKATLKDCVHSQKTRRELRASQGM